MFITSENINKKQMYSKGDIGHNSIRKEANESINRKSMEKNLCKAKLVFQKDKVRRQIFSHTRNKRETTQVTNIRNEKNNAAYFMDIKIIKTNYEKLIMYMKYNSSKHSLSKIL